MFLLRKLASSIENKRICQHLLSKYHIVFIDFLQQFAFVSCREHLKVWRCLFKLSLLLLTAAIHASLSLLLLKHRLVRTQNMHNFIAVVVNLKILVFKFDPASRIDRVALLLRR